MRGPHLRSAPRWSRRCGAALLWLGAIGIVWLSVRRGRTLQRAHPEVFLGAAPLVGRNFADGWDWRFGWGLVGAATVAIALVIACWRDWWWRLRLRWVFVATSVSAMVFAVSLALTDGADGVLYAAEHKTEYLANLPNLPPAGEFLRTFIARIATYSVHLRGHPPGFVLLLKLLHWIGLGGRWPTALLSILATGVLPLAVLIVVRVIAGNDWVRRAAPFLVVAPYALWMVTSADAVYTAVGALGTAAIAVGIGRRGVQAAACGLAGGLLLGALLFGTYLAAMLLVVPAVVVGVGVRRAGTAVVALIVAAVVGGVAVLVAFRVGGFWWLAGARATRTQYWLGSAQFRTWGYFGFANIAVALIALGPATLLGLTRLRSGRMWLLVGAALAVLAASHLSQYTKGEVERIWLLFYPWIALAAASVFVACAPPAGIGDAGVERAALRTRRRGALVVGAQASCAIVLQAALVSKW